MKTINKIVLFILMLLMLPFAAVLQTDVYRIKKIIIDAGHGGKDPGALGSNVYEKNLVLPIALKLGKLIQSAYPEIEVIYTRDADFFVELNKRAEIANNEMADLFISIHANANLNKKRNGCETYIMGPASEGLNFEVAKRENSVIVYEEDYIHKYEGFDVENPETRIILSLIQNAFREQSLILATKVQEQMVKLTKRKDGGVHQQGFFVLWKTNMPSILVETGYVSNSSDEAYLMSTAGQNAYSQAIFNAFKDYKTVMEQRSWFSEELLKIQKPSTENQNNTNTTNKNERTPKQTTTKPTKENDNKSISFGVQIYTSSKKMPLDSPRFKGLSEVFEYEHNGSYKYAVGKKVLSKRQMH